MDITEIETIIRHFMVVAEINASQAQCDTQVCFYEGQRSAFRTALQVLTDARECAKNYVKFINDLREENES